MVGMIDMSAFNIMLSAGTFSVLQVVFLLQRHTGYFLIQVLEQFLKTEIAQIYQIIGLPSMCINCGPQLGRFLVKQGGNIRQGDFGYKKCL